MQPTTATPAPTPTSEVVFLSEMTVDLVDHMGDDASFIRAARVSTRGQNTVRDPDKGRGLINYLMQARHGSVFEHAALTFFIEAPIFTFREFHRHRIASYNEMSGRYKVLPPRFYLPTPQRKLRNQGTSARPEFAPGTPQQYKQVQEAVKTASYGAWIEYQEMLQEGVANEVARIVLPLNTMSQMYTTMNPRALMNFLSLRIDHPEAKTRSRPQHEIQLVAEQMEAHFKTHFPLTHEAFQANGRTAP